MKIRRMPALLLCLCLMLSLFGTAAAAFSDLEGHWAEQYMTDLVNRGYLKGYNDGLMRPNDQITGAQALTLLARFYALDEEGMARLYDDYGAAAEKYLPEKLNWAWEGAAVCLAANIVTEAELSGMKLEDPIEKEYLAELLIRAMQLKSRADALTDVELTFDDTADITLARRPYVRLLMDIGVIEGTDTNEFKPHSNVTRAVVAKMISVALDYMEKTGVMPTLPEYMNVYLFEGVVSEYSGKLMYITSLDGETREYTVESDTRLVVTGGEAVSSYIGRYVTAVVDRDTQALVRLEVDASGALWTQGTFYSGVNAAATRTVSVTEVGKSENTILKVASDVKATLSGSSIDYTKITKGSFVSVRHDGTTADQITAVSGTATRSGTITEIDYGLVITLHIKAEDGAPVCVRIDAAKLPKIVRGTTTISIDRLRVGDKVSVYFARNVAESIEVEGQQASLKGQLTAIASTMDGTTLTVVNGEKTYTYLLESNVGVWQGTKELSVSDLKAGQQVSIVVYADRITEVYIEESSIVSTSVTGTVLSVDTTSRQILILSDGKLIYVQTKIATPILSTGKGQTMVLANVEPNVMITAYGSYEGTIFNATSVILP